MTINRPRAERVGKPWPHLIIATIFSLLVPYLGSAYLGLKAATPQEEWQRRAFPLSMLMLAALIWVDIVNYCLAFPALAAATWLLLCLISVISLWRAVRRGTQSIVVVPNSAFSLTFAFNIVLFGALGFTQTHWLETTFFKAPQETPLVAAGTQLYGFRYQPLASDNNIRIQRGQLILATLGGAPRLLRVIGVPGDIFAAESHRLFVNGTEIGIGARTEGGTRSELEDLVQALAYPDTWQEANVLERLSERQAQVIAPDELMVATDEDLMSIRIDGVPIHRIFDSDVIALPWAKFWGVRDHPGRRSELLQRDIAFVD